MSTTVQFPPVGIEEETKLKKFLANMSEFMGLDFKIDEVKIIQVTVGDYDSGAAAILTKVAANETKKKKATTQKGKAVSK